VRMVRGAGAKEAVSYTHLDVYKRQGHDRRNSGGGDQLPQLRQS